MREFNDLLASSCNELGFWLCWIFNENKGHEVFIQFNEYSSLISSTYGREKSCVSLQSSQSCAVIPPKMLQIAFQGL
jgi:hypothetical protein